MLFGDYGGCIASKCNVTILGVQHQSVKGLNVLFSLPRKDIVKRV